MQGRKAKGLLGSSIYWERNPCEITIGVLTL